MGQPGKIARIITCATASVFLAGTSLAGPTSTNSSQIPSRYGSIYSTSTPSCSVCHGNNSSQKPNESGVGTSYGRALDTALVGSGFSVFQIDSAIRSLETSFAPYVSNVAGTSFSQGNTSLRSVTVTGTTNSIFVSLNPGRTFTNSLATLSTFGVDASSDLAGLLPGSATTTFNLNVSGISAIERGNRRRANSPFTLNMVPQNSIGQRPTISSTRNRTRIRVTFANIAPVGANDLNFIATESNTSGNPLKLEVLPNDSDSDSNNSTLTAQLVSAMPAADGSVALDPTNTFFEYTLPATLPQNPKNVSFTYRPVDNEGQVGNVTTVQIAIPGQPPENPPVAVNDSFSTNEDVVLNGDVSTNDSDPEGINTVTFSVSADPSVSLGSVVMSTDGSFVFTPVDNANGSTSFEYTAFDGTFSDTATVDITVNPVNDAPVAVNDTAVAGASNDAANPLIIDVLNNDSDIDSSNLTVELASGLSGGASDGTLTLNATNDAFTYAVPNPLPATSRSTSFTYRARDDQGDTSQVVTVTISIPALVVVGGPPVAADDAFTLDEDTVLNGDVRVDNGNGPDVDPDGLNTVTFSLNASPPASEGDLSFNNDGTFTFTPAANFNGTSSFTYSAFDGTTSDTASVSLTINAVNDPPVAVAETAVAALSNTQGNPLVIDVLANDSDADGDDLTVELVAGLPGGAADGTLSINGAGTEFQYVMPDPAPSSARSVRFSYRPVDSSGAPGNTVEVEISVPAAVINNEAPVAADDEFTFDEDTVLTGDLALDNGSGVDTDPDGDALTYSVRTAPAADFGTLTLDANGSFTFTPEADKNGQVTFEYTVFDGAATDTGSVTLNISPVNDAPRVDVIALTSRDEAAADFVQDLLSPDRVVDVDGDSLTVSDVQFTLVDPPNLQVRRSDFVTRQRNILTFVPTAYGEKGSGDLVGLDDNETAELTVTYFVSDGIADPVENTLTLTITGIDNGLGRLAGAYADTISGKYNGHFGGTAQANGSCHTCHLPGRVDVDVDTRDECVQSPPVFNAYGLNLCLNRDADQAALADLNRRMSEAEPRFAPSLPAVDRIEINQTLMSGDAIGVPFVADPGLNVDGNVTEIVDYLIVANDVPSRTDEDGQFTIDASGQLRVATDNLIPDTYNFVVLPVNDAGQRDNAGNLRNGIPGFYPTVPQLQTIITVVVRATLPVAVADSADVEAGMPQIIDVLANDTGGGPARLRIDTAPAQGVAEVNSDFTVTYTPNAGFTGNDSFTYISENNAGESQPARVDLQVLPSGSLIAQDDVSATLIGTPVTIPVLANDANVVSSGSDATIVTIVTPPDPAFGTLSVSGQSLLFTPASGFSGGEVTAEYQARNPGVAGSGSVATLRINVVDSSANTISSALTNPELVRVAQAFEQTCAAGAGGNSEFLATCANLTAAAANGEDLNQAMRALRNEEHFAAVDLTDRIARGLGQTIRRRLDRIRDGDVLGFDISGMSFSFQGEQVPDELVQSLFNTVTGFSAAEGLAAVGWGLFASGEFAFGDRDGDSLSDGYDLSIGSFTLGADRSFGARSRYGLALGYSDGETDFNDGGSMRAEGIQLSLYGFTRDVFAEGVDFEGYFSVGRVDYTSDRRIRFTANGVEVDAMAQASFNGTYVNLVPMLSYTQNLSRYGDALGDLRTGTEVTWSIGLDYLRMELDDYTETGGAGLGLTTNSSDYDSLQTFLEFRARRPIWVGPRRSSEIHGGFLVRAELLDDQRSVTSSFAAGGPTAPSFVVTEDGTQNFAATLNLGSRLALDAGELTLDYAFDFNDADLRQHSFAVGYSREFPRNGSTLQMGFRGSPSKDYRDDAALSLDYKLDF